MLVIDDNLDELHTFESFFTMRLENDSLLIRFINAGISNHRINPLREIRYIDKCMMCCHGIEYLFVDRKKLIGDTSKLQKHYFGGIDLLDDTHKDIEVCAKDIHMIIPESYKLSDKFFLPIDTPKFRQNMPTIDVIQFLCSEADLNDIKR